MGNTSFRLEVSVLGPNCWGQEAGWRREQGGGSGSCTGVLRSIQMSYFKQVPVNEREATALQVALNLNF